MDLFKKNQKVALIFQTESKTVEITCVINKVMNDRLELILPQYFMRYINYLKVGKRLSAKGFSKLGTLDFNTVVISSPLEDSFLIELDYNSIKLNSGSDVPKIHAVETLQVKREDSVLILKTIEITTEYLKFYTDKKFKIDEKIECDLILPDDYGIINIKGFISEIDPVYSNEYTLRYSTMREDSRQIILYYMYMYTKDSD